MIYSFSSFLLLLWISRLQDFLIIVLILLNDYSPPKPSKFFNFWSKQPDFLKTVQGAWPSENGGSPMFVLLEKLKNVKNALR